MRYCCSELKERGGKGLTNRVGWQTGEDVFKWWLGENPLQLTFEDVLNMDLT